MGQWSLPGGLVEPGEKLEDLQRNGPVKISVGEPGPLVASLLLFSLGLRPPYSRVTDAVIQFIRDVTEPYLRIFRRILPPFGGLDFSPILALIALTVVGRIIVSAIHG